MLIFYYLYKKMYNIYIHIHLYIYIVIYIEEHVLG